MVIEEVADKRTGYDDDERKDEEEETRVRAYAKASRVHGNECQHTAVGKKDKPAKDDRRKRLPFKEIRKMKSVVLFPRRTYHARGQPFPIS